MDIGEPEIRLIFDDEIYSRPMLENPVVFEPVPHLTATDVMWGVTRART
jgi:hypothetical protein